MSTSLVFYGCLMFALGSTPVHDSIGPDKAAGVVSAATPDAAAAGVEILEAGGNAVDAAVAIAFALGVTEPFGSGLGGQIVLLIHPPDGEPFVINGSSLAPRGVPSNATTIDLEGHKASTVPSTAKVLDLAWRKCGSGRMGWDRLLAPAIRRAEDGYKIGPYQHGVLRRHVDSLKESPMLAELFLRPDGSVPQRDSTFRQPRLAETLRRLAHHGADDFYTGSIAAEIVQDMQSNGGWIAAADLAEFPEPQIVAPLHRDYRGWDVYTLPPPFGGWVVLQALEILERAPEADVRPTSPLHSVWMAEALRVGHRRRQEEPIRNLLDYEQEVASRFRSKSIKRLIKSFSRPESDETTHFSVVDADGLAVSATASINAFYGALVAHPNLGFPYNDYMRDFVDASPDHPYALAPGAMAYSSMSATIIARDGCPQLVLGSPGSKRIISTVAQVITHWIDGPHDVVKAVAAPRMHVLAEESMLCVEQEQIRPAELADLERRGFRVVLPISSQTRNRMNPYFGGVHAVAWEQGAWRGAADPRRDGAVRYAKPVQNGG